MFLSFEKSNSCDETSTHAQTIAECSFTRDGAREVSPDLGLNSPSERSTSLFYDRSSGDLIILLLVRPSPLQACERVATRRLVRIVNPATGCWQLFGSKTRQTWEITLILDRGERDVLFAVSSDGTRDG